MGILDNIPMGNKLRLPGRPGKRAGDSPGTDVASRAGARGSAGPGSGSAVAGRPRPGPPGSRQGPGRSGGRKGGKRRRKGGAPSPKERIASAAAPLHDRRRRLVGARESTLRDLGGLMLEMYKRNRFREELLLDKCEEVLAIEVEIAHVDQRLFQLAPPNAAGMRPIGRCECGAPIHPGQNFCGVCGRSFATLTQGRSCTRCGAGLRPGDQYCPTCGTEAPDALQTIEAGPPSGMSPEAPTIDAATIATTAVADTVVIEAPPIDEGVVEAPPQVEQTPPLEGDGPPAAASPGAAGAGESGPPRQQAVAAESPPPAPSPAGFDWTAPPPAPDAAMDAAMDELPPNPTDPGTPFAGFPLTSTVPPPPVADPADTALPDASAAAVPSHAPSPPAPEQPAPAPSPLRPSPSRAERPDATSRTAEEPAEQEGSQATADAAAPSDPKAAKAAAKAAAAEQKQLEKARKARAKQRAKAARAARKRGGGE